jgi:TetR/AcrR family transcriptional regulator, cholesterol catabolism regulator
VPRLRPYAIRNAPPGSAPTQTRAAPPKPEELTANQLARRMRIVDAGVTLMHSREYEDIQIREVAEAAALALGTVYRYFASKEHLFSAVFFAWLTILSEEIEAEPATGDDNRARLTDVLFRTIRAFEQQPSFYSLLVMTNRTSDPFVRETRAAMQENSERVLAAPLVDVSDEDRTVVVMVVGAMLEAALGSWLSGAISIDDVYSRTARLVSLLRLPD